MLVERESGRDGQCLVCLKRCADVRCESVFGDASFEEVSAAVHGDCGDKWELGWFCA